MRKGKNRAKRVKSISIKIRFWLFNDILFEDGGLACVLEDEIRHIVNDKTKSINSIEIRGVPRCMMSNSIIATWANALKEMNLKGFVKFADGSIENIFLLTDTHPNTCMC